MVIQRYAIMANLPKLGKAGYWTSDPDAVTVDKKKSTVKEGGTLVYHIDPQNLRPANDTTVIPWEYDGYSIANEGGTVSISDLVAVTLSGEIAYTRNNNN